MWLLFNETAGLCDFITCDLSSAEGENRKGGVRQVESTKKGKQCLRHKSRGTKESCRISCKWLEVALQVLGEQIHLFYYIFNDPLGLMVEVSSLTLLI